MSLQAQLASESMSGQSIERPVNAQSTMITQDGKKYQLIRTARVDTSHEKDIMYTKVLMAPYACPMSYTKRRRSTGQVSIPRHL